jgi:hypothetical protein
MAKKKQRKDPAKSAKSSKSSARRVPATTAPADPPRNRPAGQRFYDLPYSAPAPRMINADLGLHNLVARAGHNAAYEIDVTLLDAPDHRLIRSGVLLAHRVLDGRGEWFLTAPDWQPLLPKDRIELMGHADLPDELADLVRPLRRRATLGPVAALSCERREFAVRDDHGTTLALVRDDKVTVRRGGLTTARYREVMMTPVGPGLDEDQVGWLDRAMMQAGATAVPRFPRLVTRLGAPATGPTDLPEVTPFDPTSSVKRFISQLVARRLRELVKADLAIRGGDLVAIGRLVEAADLLRGELEGLSELLDPEWVTELVEELAWLSASDPVTGVDDPNDRSQMTTRLRGERYLALLERLVAAARLPRVSEVRSQPISEVLADLTTAAVTRFRRDADRLSVESGTVEWTQVWTALGRLDQILAVTGPVVGEATAEIARAIGTIAPLLAEVQADHEQAEAARERIADLSAEEAFAAGRTYERLLASSQRNRRHFVKTWAKARKALDA